MMHSLSIAVALYGACALSDLVPVSVSSAPPVNTSAIVPLDFLSYSIEFSFWGDYVGFEFPNVFTNNLMQNLRAETGGDLKFRVGGATQDRTVFVATQQQPIIDFWNYTYNLDQPQNSTIGPSFWDSFKWIQGAQYIFGLNLVDNKTGYLENLYNEVSQSRQKIPPEQLFLFELGNEADQYIGNGFRPANWTQLSYVHEWWNKTEAMNAVNNRELRFFAPSYAAESSSKIDFNSYTVWNATYNINKDGWVDEVSQHGYITCSSSNPTLAGDIMNHTTTVRFAEPFAELCAFHRAAGRIFTMGETNSICGQGSHNVSDVFGSALWGIDYSLYSAANNITRMHFHQGTGYRYASWQPITINGTAPLTKPPYYGNIFVARFVGNSGKTQIVNYPLEGSVNVAYGAYDDGKLARLVFLNFNIFNLSLADGAARPNNTFTFPAPEWANSAEVTLLTAPEATSNSSITFGGYSYDYNLAEGRPVKVAAGDTTIKPVNGMFSVDVGASQAVMVTLNEQQWW